jgi:hypothetical protein
MSITPHRHLKDRTKKEQMAAYIKTADKYINGARAVARGYMKQNKILRSAVWIMGAACIIMVGLLYWRWHGF